MYDYLTSCNVDRLDSAALNYFGKKVTHRQMQEKIDACARALTAYGVRAGDAVSLCVLAMPEGRRADRMGYPTRYRSVL